MALPPPSPGVSFTPVSILPGAPWRLLHSPPATGAENMALDEALLRRARRTGECVFRVYAWSRPTLSLGRHQTAAGRYDLARAATEGIGFVRRPTGGRALLHHREVTYSVTAPVTGTGPAAEAGSLSESYAALNRLLLDGLQRLGVPVQVARPAGRAPLPTDAPCFETPTAGELVVGERKLVGSAQWREGGALLQHGSILVDDDQGWAAALLRHPAPPPPPPATLRDALGRAPTLDEVALALFAAVRALADPAARALTDGELAATLPAGELAELRRQYEDDAWTWRR